MLGPMKTTTLNDESVSWTKDYNLFKLFIWVSEKEVVEQEKGRGKNSYTVLEWFKERPQVPFVREVVLAIFF